MTEVQFKTVLDLPAAEEMTAFEPGNQRFRRRQTDKRCRIEVLPGPVLWRTRFNVP